MPVYLDGLGLHSSEAQVRFTLAERIARSLTPISGDSPLLSLDPTGYVISCDGPGGSGDAAVS